MRPTQPIDQLVDYLTQLTGAERNAALKIPPECFEDTAIAAGWFKGTANVLNMALSHRAISEVAFKSAMQELHSVWQGITAAGYLAARSRDPRLELVTALTTLKGENLRRKLGLDAVNYHRDKEEIEEEFYSHVEDLEEFLANELIDQPTFYHAYTVLQMEWAKVIERASRLQAYLPPPPDAITFDVMVYAKSLGWGGLPPVIQISSEDEAWRKWILEETLASIYELMTSSNLISCSSNGIWVSDSEDSTINFEEAWQLKLRGFKKCQYPNTTVVGKEYSSLARLLPVIHVSGCRIIVLELVEDRLDTITAIINYCAHWNITLVFGTEIPMPMYGLLVQN